MRSLVQTIAHFVLASAAAVGLSVTFAARCHAQTTAPNWHQWRGPDANGTSPTAKPPTKWSESENIQWKIELPGRGTSTPIIWDDKVFVLSAARNGKKDMAIPDPSEQPKTNYFDIKRPNEARDFLVLCLDRNTGKEIWRRTAVTKIPHEGAHQDNDFASASPTTDGQRLVCWFGSAGLFCYTLDGEQLWQRDLGEVPVGSSLGEGCSPVLHNGKIVILRDHSGQSTIEVFDADTGTPVWQRERDEDNAWATPLVTEFEGRTQVITAASGAIVSYALDSGNVIWRCSGLSGNVIPCPLRIDDQVICMSGYQGFAALSVSLSSTGDVSDTEQVHWQLDKDTPYIPSPVLVREKLYFTKSNQGIVTCVDARSGKELFGRQRLGALSNLYASPVAADGKTYFVGRSGATVVLKANSNFQVLAVNSLDERFDASPAVAGKQIFLRGEKHLYCIQSPTNDAVR